MFARGFKTWCENTSRGLRKGMNLRPIDPLDQRALAAHLGLITWNVDEVPGLDSGTLDVLTKDDPSAWSAVTIRVDGRTAIIVNTAHSMGRTSSNLAHEIAHVVLDHEPAHIGLTTDGILLLNTFNRTQEAEADWLAGCLLLPRDAILDARRQGLEAADISRLYVVSDDMATYRLRMTGVDRQVGRSKATRRPARKAR